MSIDHTKVALDVGAVGGTAAVLMGLIPKISAVLTVIYLAVRLYETVTVQKLIKRIWP